MSSVISNLYAIRRLVNVAMQIESEIDYLHIREREEYEGII